MEGLFKCGCPHFWRKKKLGFLKMYGVSVLRTDKGGVELARTFCPKIAKHLHQPEMFNGSRVLYSL